MIEDFPGHYIESNLASYGRYDDGTEFPKGHRQVDRFLNGSFVIFSKQSVYNHISGTYDARHNKMSSMEFRHYIGTISDPWYSGRFDKTYADVTRGCEAFLEYLIEQGEV